MLKCKIELNTETDRAYWVRWDKFKECVDPIDLYRREAKVIEDYYLASWFRVENGECYFKPPAFHLVNGVAFL